MERKRAGDESAAMERTLAGDEGAAMERTLAGDESAATKRTLAGDESAATERTLAAGPYTHPRAHETKGKLGCRLLLYKKKQSIKHRHLDTNVCNPSGATSEVFALPSWLTIQSYQHRSGNIEALCHSARHLSVDVK